MRVGCYGLIWYWIAHALRATTDIEVVFYLDEREEAVKTSYRSAFSDAPSWVVPGAYSSPQWLLRPWRSPVVDHFRTCDILLVSELGPMFAQFAGRPTYFFPTGGDLTVMPFPFRARHLRGDLRQLLSTSIIGTWQRRGIRRVEEIWTAPFAPYLLGMQRLGVPDERRSPEYFPVAVDDEQFADSPERRCAAARRFPEVAASGRFRVFHPSRLMMDAHPFLVETGQWKRNEVLLEGFAAFARATPEADAVLVLIDQAFSPHRAKARAVCEALGIADRVKWVPAPDGSGLSHNDMRDLYLLADVVADDFGAGWFGNVALEASASARPVVTYVNEAVMNELYGRHPLISARSSDEIATALTALFRDPAHRQRLGALGREWVISYHGRAAISERYRRAIARRLERAAA